jgi:hypothetical protein
LPIFNCLDLNFSCISTCFSIIGGTGQFGRILGPIVITMMYNMNTPPIIVFSIVFLIGGAIPVLFLK